MVVLSYNTSFLEQFAYVFLFFQAFVLFHYAHQLVIFLCVGLLTQYFSQMETSVRNELCNYFLALHDALVHQ